jgi:hypothetical protein
MRRALTLIIPLTFAVAVLGGGPGDKGYTFQPIDAPPAVFPGTQGLGINSPGVILGNFYDADFVGHGFVLRAGQFTYVTIDGSAYTELWDANSQGTAVGDFIDEAGNFRGFVYSADGTITYLPDPAPGASSQPSGINGRGAITGDFSADGYATIH